MLAKFKAYIEQQHLFTNGEKVLLAVSGGRDSVAMADLMHRAGQPFAIAHCNFHLRPGDCDRDQFFVHCMAEHYGVPFFTTDFDTRSFATEGGYSVEEAARMLRYRWFTELCSEHGFSCVAVAHHRDDSIETFFLNLFRGTGIAGLHGIRPEVEAENGTLKVVRPLLCFSRADIDTYIAEHGLVYVEDSTNHELDARRNRIRLQLMPLLRELYPSVDITMQANIDRLHDTELVYNAYLDSLRARLIHPYINLLPTLPFDAMEISVADLRAELDSHNWPESTRQTIVFELLRQFGFNASVSTSLFQALDSDSGLLFHSPTHTAELHRGRIIIAPKVPTATPQITIEEVPECDPRALGPTAIAVDADLVRQPFTLRPWRDGDRFRPFGMKGSRLVSDFLKDCGMPQVERRHVHILLDDEGQPVWLVGLRPDERTRVTSATTRILKIYSK